MSFSRLIATIEPMPMEAHSRIAPGILRGDCCRRSRFVARASHRCSCAFRPTDWIDGGWDIQQSVELAPQLKEAWSRPDRLLFWRQCAGMHKFPVGPGYQTQFAEQIRRGSQHPELGAGRG